MRGGGPLRSASILAYLAQRYSVHLVVFRQPRAPDAAAAIPRDQYTELDTMELPHHSRHPLARAFRNSRRLLVKRPPLIDRFAGFENQISAVTAADEYEVAVIEHFWCAPYLEQLRPRCRLVILDLHNIESQWHHSLAESQGFARGWALRRFAAASESLERQWLPRFDSILVTSPEDAQLVREMANQPAIVFPNALPPIDLPPRRERNEIAFSGNLEYEPNISAIRWFQTRVWPPLKRSWPELQWKIIGKNPGAVRELVRGDSKIQLTGPVEDAISELASARIAVVPILGGSGTRIKILEAWAAGTAVVSTTIGAQGLQARDEEHLLLADTADQFVAAVARLLSSPEDRARIGSAGRQLYEQRYTWPKAWEALDSLFGNLASINAV